MIGLMGCMYVCILMDDGINRADKWVTVKAGESADERKGQQQCVLFYILSVLWRKKRVTLY